MDKWIETQSKRAATIARLRKNPDVEEFITEADGASVKIGNDEFNICIPNGYGDGDVRVFVVNHRFDKDGNDNVYGFEYFTSFEAEEQFVYVYCYDCGYDKTYEFSAGSYSVYYGEWENEGTVIFVKSK